MELTITVLEVKERKNEYQGVEIISFSHFVKLEYASKFINPVYGYINLKQELPKDTKETFNASQIEMIQKQSSDGSATFNIIKIKP